MATKQPLLSIVIPTYNHAHFLKDAIQSLLSQTYPHWEAFIINNYSEDNTTEVVKAFRERRIELVNFQNYGVIAASRNEGIRRAGGEYVAFLDSDDVWKPAKLERCLERLNSGCDLVCHGTIWRWNDGRTRQVVHGPEKRATYRALLYGGNRIATSATVVRKKILDEVGGFSTEPNFVTAEDYELWLRIARAGGRLCFIPGMLGEYRIHEGNASHQGTARDAALAVVNHHFELDSDPRRFRHLKQRIRRSQIITENARGLGRMWAFRLAWSESIRALRVWPLNWRAYAIGLLAVLQGTIRSLKKRS